MQIVMTFGNWDLLHAGHVGFLEQCQKLGDRLVVGCPADDIVSQETGKYPVVTLKHRMKMLTALKCVDVVIPYYEFNFKKPLQFIIPDILIIGEKWGSSPRHEWAESFIYETSGRIVRIPDNKELSTSEIKKRIKENNL